MEGILAVKLYSRDNKIVSHGYKSLSNDIITIITEIERGYLENGNYRLINCGSMDIYCTTGNYWTIFVIYANTYLLRNVVLLCKEINTLNKITKTQINELVGKFNSGDIDKITQLNSKITDISEIMQNNMQKMHKKNEKTEKIEQKAQVMKDKSQVFVKRSRKARWRIWLSYYLCIS